MAINFNALPTDKPNAIIPAGTYYATIEKAEMKPPKPKNGVQGPDYLNLTLGIKDKNGKSMGKIFDMLSESDHELVRYKVQRFITALEIPIVGNFELKDLCKIVQGKQFIVDSAIQPGKDGYPDKAVVDIFTNEIYYPMAKASEIFGATEGGDSVINAADAADAVPPAQDEEY